VHKGCPVCSIPSGTEAAAAFLCKADGVLAGLAIADAVFAACDAAIEVRWSRRDGDRIRAGEEFGTVHGSARAILRAERVALNFMQVRCPLSGPSSLHTALLADCKLVATSGRATSEHARVRKADQMAAAHHAAPAHHTVQLLSTCLRCSCGRGACYGTCARATTLRGAKQRCGYRKGAMTRFAPKVAP
jgi:Quinolinate phosphoribosyl transferase, N-terminal domain